MLKKSGVYTHLVTDNKHYWGDGGATYHGRFNTFEFFRGQEGDAWKGQLADPEIPETVNKRSDPLWRQDWINRGHMQDEKQHPQTLTFDAGLDFIGTNKDQDNWFLQIEAFDPHEPFFSYDVYRELYEEGYTGRHFDWPMYRKVIENDQESAHLKNEYNALLTMCDRSLGRVLDAMDENGLWEDTMLMVCTDHGLLLGEHNWWGKNVQPWYDENIHTPLFLWDPRSAETAGQRRASLVQTIDFGPTLLEYFSVPVTADMQGVPLANTVANDQPVRAAGLFGNTGGHVNVTDGRYVYMRACGDESNSPLFDYTLMPMHMHALFSPAELRNAELVEPFTFTKGAPVLKVPAFSFGNPYVYGTLLFDLQTDPAQDNPLRDKDLELKMATLLRDCLKDSDAPVEQYERLALPVEGPLGEEHLLIDKQWEQVQKSMRPAPLSGQLPVNSPLAQQNLSDLFEDGRTKEIVLASIPFLANPFILMMAGSMTLVEIAAMKADITLEDLLALDELIAVPAGS
nr:sulfatase-like hydrolase/transferase [Pseudarthrobacter psychrotolerans]